MSNDDGWWARQLGGQAPRPRNEAPMAPNQYQTPHTPYGAPQGQQYQGPPQGYQQGPPQQQQPQVTVENFFEAAKTWQGGPAARTEIYACPECGGNHFYTRQNGPSRGPAPAPLCMDCGFNGMFSQGDPATWGATG